jgi:SAM-dependent methyltransferase
MSWEETIIYIRARGEYANLVHQSYLLEDLELNIKNFSHSDEFKETIELIESKKPGPLRILDVGCGNGIAAISFARLGHEVVAIDPDPSSNVGTGAVNKLKHKLGLKNILIFTSRAEELDLHDESFDIIYSRQAMHHAYDLNRFVANCTRLLKKGGIFITIRDHVIYNEKDKLRFLNEHALHKFYHGENAYRSSDYRKAFNLAGLEILREIKFFDSVINYFPLKLSDIEDRIQREHTLIDEKLKNKMDILGNNSLARFLYRKFIFDPSDMKIEKFYSGRMYSYVSIKK